VRNYSHWFAPGACFREPVRLLRLAHARPRWRHAEASSPVVRHAAARTGSHAAGAARRGSARHPAGTTHGGLVDGAGARAGSRATRPARPRVAQPDLRRARVRVMASRPCSLANRYMPPIGLIQVTISSRSGPSPLNTTRSPTFSSGRPTLRSVPQIRGGQAMQVGFIGTGHFFLAQAGHRPLLARPGLQPFPRQAACNMARRSNRASRSFNGMFSAAQRHAGGTAG